MKRLSVVLVVSLALLGTLVLGCAQPTPAPTQAPPSPAKAAEPTKAPAAAQPIATKAAEPTKGASAPATKSDFPAKGKAISLIVPYAAGGANDLAARMLAPLMEKELGVPVQVVNKAGAGSQVGLTDLVNSKPDGYTLAYTIFAPAITSYLDKEQKAVYNKDSFQPLGNHFTFPNVMSVQKDSPFKTVKDVIDAAKAEPGAVKVGTTGILGTPHLGSLQFQKATGVKFAAVQFEGGAPALTALLGGHIDVAFNPLSEVVPHFKADKIRVLGILDSQGSQQLPGVKTMEAQGYKIQMVGASGVSAPAKTPRDVVDILAASIKKALTDPEHVKKLEEMGYTPKYLGPDEYTAFWKEYEAQVAPLMDLAKEEATAK